MKEFVNHLLYLRNSSEIQKLRIYWDCTSKGSCHIESWIRTAMKRKVTELDLHVGFRYGFDGDRHLYKLPGSLLMCKTLLVLKLRSGFEAKIPTSGCFPSLKILHITCMNYYDDSLVKIFSNCPVLEDLTIEGYRLWPAETILKVDAPALKILRLCCDRHEPYNHSINCPKLENLVLEGSVTSKYCLGKSDSLVKASIELLNHHSDKDPCFSRVTSLVEGVSSVKVLCVSAQYFEVGPLPAFVNLIKLKLELHDWFSWELLTEFLNSSPHLQYLVLEHTATTFKEYWSDSESEERPKPRWHAPELVPSCLESNLETLSIKGFTEQQNAIEVAKYILRNGEVLKKMTSSSDPSCAEKQASYKELLKVPRISEACTVDLVSYENCGFE